MMEQQHEAISALTAQATELVARWEEAAAAGERDAVADTLAELYDAICEHLAAEEEHILPLAAECLTEQEWQQLGEEGMQRTERKLIPLLVGSFMYEGDRQVIASMLSHAPLLPRLLMPRIGPRAYAKHAQRVYGTSRP